MIYFRQARYPKTVEIFEFTSENKTTTNGILFPLLDGSQNVATSFRRQITILS